MMEIVVHDFSKFLRSFDDELVIFAPLSDVKWDNA